MPNGYIRIKNDMRYFRKDHFCPSCGNQISKVSVSKVVNSNSPEAENYDFRVGRMRVVGDVQFTWDEFECQSCKKHFSVDEVKKSEGIAVRTPRSKMRKVLWYVVALLIFLLYGFLKYKNIF